MGKYSNEFIIRGVVVMQIRARTTVCVCVNGFLRDKCVHSTVSYFSRVCDIIGARLWNNI